MSNPPNQQPEQWGQNPDSQPTAPQPQHQPSGSPHGQPSANQPGAGQQYPGQYGQGQQYPGQYAQGQEYPGQYAQGQQYPGQYAQGQQYPGQYGQGQYAQGKYAQAQPPYGTEPPRKNNTPVIIVAGILALALIAGLIWWFNRDRNEVATPTSVTTTQAQTTEQQTTEQQTTEQQSTDDQTTTDEQSSEAETTAQSTAPNTGSVPDDPGAWTSTSADSIVPVDEFAGLSKMNPTATSTLMTLYQNSSTGQAAVAMVLKFPGGKTARGKLIDPVVSGDFVCGKVEEDNTSSNCYADLSDGYVQFTSTGAPAEAGTLATEWMKASAS